MGCLGNPFFFIDFYKNLLYNIYRKNKGENKCCGYI